VPLDDESEGPEMTLPAPHIPVLIDEVMAALSIAPGETHVDGTFGAGGYSQAFLKAGASVIAFDRDESAVAAANMPEGVSFRLVNANFSSMAAYVEEPVDGVTLDIGVSSMQLDQPERGFSFQQDGPLDMRMAQDGESAADFLNTAEEETIANVIFRYGDEPKSRRIARFIVASRPLTRTAELARVVRKAVGWRDGDKKDPATRTFQAVRIHVNRELEELEAGLDAAEQILKPGGRLAVVTFHSLEDRIVKAFLRDRCGNAPSGSRHLPAQATAKQPSFDRPSKPIRPSEAELARNPRARSATLRFAHRTSQPAWSSKEST
jgi:16S rRNA (cytosine1402-N4)-methyltransferase